ncbi:MAG: winged helix-turn-helix domain-containing protein [Acidobacteriota bacterium]
MTAKSLVYRFDNHIVEIDEFRLFKDGEPVTVERKAFQVLAYLLENPGRLVTKEELLESVWKESFVTPNVLTRVITQLRKALGDKAQDSRYIETVPTHGYRFIAHIEKSSGTADQLSSNESFGDDSIQTNAPTRNVEYPAANDTERSTEPERFWASRRGAVALGICVLLLAGGIGYFVGFRVPAITGTQIAPDNTLAVLPFKLLEPNEDNSYLGVGLTDSLITKLSNVRNLTVRPTLMVLRYAPDGTDPSKAGADLGVQSVISGTVQKVDGHVRVNVQMTRVSDGKPFWANTFDVPFVSFFQVQDEISARIMDSLKIRLSKDEQSRLDRHPTENVDALQLYMRAVYHINKLNPDDLKTAIGEFNEAITLDPNYALAYARLANAYGIASSFGFPSAQALCESSALKAIALDPTLAEAQTSLAVLQFWGYHNIDKAQDSFVHALELDPNSVYTHQYYGWFLVAIGHFDEAARHIDRAIELAPFDINLQTDKGLPLFFNRRYKESAEVLRKVLAFNDSTWFVHLSLGFSCEGYGDLKCAISELRRAVDLSRNEPTVQASLARAIALSGDSDEARRILARLEAEDQSHLSYYYVALAYLALDDKETALNRLEHAADKNDKWIGWLKVDPRLDPIRSEPRFNDLLIKTKLK